MKNETNELIQFKKEQIDLIKQQIAPEATNDELKLFLYQAQRTGLDPLTRQIYCIHRNVKTIEYGKDVWKKKMSIQTSIDGFRVIAERSGQYAGQDEPIYTEENNKLISCKITVYKFRGDVRYPASVGVAYFSEYVQTDKNNEPVAMWKKMPHIMLAKVAEALALRKAFPQDLSGLYTSDEMADAPVKDVSPTNSFFKEPEEQMKNLSNIANEELKASAEEQKLKKLKDDLSKMQSIQEIDDYLNKKIKGKSGKESSRREIISSMSEENAKKAMDMIKFTREDLWIDQEENEIKAGTEIEGGAND
jgi:phage recombination protein Bet